MGNLFSSGRDNLSQLEDRLKNLEAVDSNRDGLVSKEELEDWRVAQQKALDEFKAHIIKVKESEYNDRLVKLQGEVADLKKINADLEHRLSQKIDVSLKSRKVELCSEDDLKRLTSDVSREKINEIVDRLIANEDINIRGFPDYIEKHLYRNMFRILLGVLGELIDSSSIKFMGHEIKMAMTPQDEVNIANNNRTSESDFETGEDDIETRTVVQ